MRGSEQGPVSSGVTSVVQSPEFLQNPPALPEGCKGQPETLLLGNASHAPGTQKAGLVSFRHRTAAGQSSEGLASALVIMLSCGSLQGSRS